MSATLTAGPAATADSRYAASMGAEVARCSPPFIASQLNRPAPIPCGNGSHRVGFSNAFQYPVTSATTAQSAPPRLRHRIWKEKPMVHSVSSVSLRGHDTAGRIFLSSSSATAAEFEVEQAAVTEDLTYGRGGCTKGAGDGGREFGISHLMIASQGPSRQPRPPSCAPAPPACSAARHSPHQAGS